jgi:type I restriction enzyme S subunit
VIESHDNATSLPEGWIQISLGEIAEINPKLSSVLKDQTEVSFLPMKAVEELTGKFDASVVVPYASVKKGYTAFINGDIIFAKITPCMENGKIAIVGNLKNGIGFGSTEFHVIRPFLTEFPRRYLFYYLIQESFRRDAKREMTGSAGQLRVQAKYMQNASLPLPPLHEQVRIVACLEEFFTKLDAGVEVLRRVKAQLKRYRQAVLKYAFQGKLTEEWQKTHKDQTEPATELLDRLKRGIRERQGPKYKELPLLDASELPKLPDNWLWTKIGELTEVIRGASPRPKGDPRYFGGNIPWIMIADVSKETGKYISKTRDTVTDEGAKKSRYLKAGTLILSNSATVCVPKILAVNGCIHDGFVAFPNLAKEIDILYLYYCFDYIRPRVIQENRQGITQVNLNTDIVRNMIIPLAPSIEQHQVVSEIERCFSVADEVEKVMEQNMKQHQRLRQSILKAAFEGKLVLQDPNDEPAEKLLERIKAERARTREPKQLELPTYVK